MLKKILILVFGFALLGALSLGIQAEEKKNHSEKPKCEKCYRNAEGKVVCETVVCPEDKKKEKKE